MSYTYSINITFSQKEGVTAVHILSEGSLVDGG